MTYNNNYYGYNNQNQNTKQYNKKTADLEYFKKIEKDFAAEAENVILKLEKDRNNEICLKTNQIRNILDLINGVSEKITLHNEEDITCYKDDILYIRVKLAYIYGKASQTDGVKDFIDKSKLIELILSIDNNKSRYQMFAKYAEALVAFHKYYGGKD